jgi:PKD domain-containing protein
LRKLYVVVVALFAALLLATPATADPVADLHHRPETPTAVWTAECVAFRCDFTAHDLISDPNNPGENMEVDYPFVYAWDFGNGSATTGDTSGHVWVTYAEPGYYPVTLTGRYDQLRVRTTWFSTVCLDEAGNGPIC